MHRLFAHGPLPDAEEFPDWGDGRWLYLPDGDPGADKANNLRNHAKLLAEAIPAMSLASGRNRVPEFDTPIGNTDMQTMDRSNGWPDRDGDTERSWLHGDYLGRASLYQSPAPGVAGFTYWDDTTPDDHPSSLVRARSYKGQVPSTGANLLNCYLVDDCATKDAWEANNAIMKPFQHGILGYTDYYNYDENESALFEVLELTRVYQNPPPFGVQKLREVADKHENMALLNQSRTKAAGAEPQTGGAIDDAVDLDSFNFGNVHSAQFVWEIQKLKGFYDMLLIQFGITQTIKP